MDNITCSPEETKAYAASLIQQKGLPRVLCLYGDLGSGKTTFVKGCAKALEIPEKNVKSPTFVLLNRYQSAQGMLFHFDCYRAEASEELFNDIQEALEKQNAWVVIEWADRVAELLPTKRIDVYLTHVSRNKRKITITIK